MFAKPKSSRPVSSSCSDFSIPSVWGAQLAMSHLHWYESRVFARGIKAELRKNSVKIKSSNVKSVSNMVKKIVSGRYGNTIAYADKHLTPTQWIMSYWQDQIFPKLVVIAIAFDAVLDFDPDLLSQIQCQQSLSDEARDAFLLVLLASTLFDQSDIGHLESSEDLKAAWLFDYDAFCVKLINHDYALRIFAGGMMAGDSLEDAWFGIAQEKKRNFASAELAFRQSALWPMLDPVSIYPDLHSSVNNIINAMELLRIMKNVSLFLRAEKSPTSIFFDLKNHKDPIVDALDVLKQHKLSKDPLLAYKSLYDLVFRQNHRPVIARMLLGERSRLLSLMQLFKHKVHEPNYPTYNDQFNAYKDESELELALISPTLK